MIRLAADGCAVAQAGLCPANMGIFALKQLAQLDIYGQLPGVFDLWLQLPDTSYFSTELKYDIAVAAVSRFSGVLTVSARADLSARALEELRVFLQQLGGYKLEGEEILLQRLGIAGDGMLPFCGSWVMGTSVQTTAEIPSLDALPKLLPDEAKLSLRPAQSLSQVYHLLCKVDARFAAQVQYDAWLADFSHRCRHQQSECYILIDETNIISTISILYFGNGEALAGGVATDPTWQNKGYARRMLAEFRRMTDARGLTVQLLAADDQLAGFYERCGWKKQVRWASRGLAPL